MVSNIYRYSDSQFKFKNIPKDLLAEESHIKQSIQDTGTFALKVRIFKMKAGRKIPQPAIKHFSTSKFDLTCYRCNQKGHISSNCMEKHQNKVFS